MQKSQVKRKVLKHARTALLLAAFPVWVALAILAVVGGAIALAGVLIFTPCVKALDTPTGGSATNALAALLR